jgi:hypothetical protein
MRGDAFDTFKRTELYDALAVGSNIRPFGQVLTATAPRLILLGAKVVF